MPPVITSFRVHGPALRALRQKSFKSLKAVATEAGIDDSYLAKLERGDNTNATQSVVDKIAAALGVSPDAFTVSKAA